MDEKPTGLGLKFISIELSGTSEKHGATSHLKVAPYPTTVHEFKEFIDAGGYSDSQWWSERGLAWRREHNVIQPAYWGTPGYEEPLLPVTGISFWEAEAYAHFRAAELPTEREWYLIASNCGTSRLPWVHESQEIDGEHANLGFFGAFAPSARVTVDRSKQSTSAAGVHDLIGNVAEWCLPGDSLELASDATTGVLRGGASWHAPGVADASFRDEVPLTVRDNQTGIRLVRREIGGPRVEVPHDIGWPNKPRWLGRSIQRPTAPFRQEGCPVGLTEQSWRLSVFGDEVPLPRTFSLAQLQEFHVTEDSGLFVCVCRWGERNTFTGAQLRHVLEACQIQWQEPGLYLLQRSAFGANGETRYETTVPLREAVEHGAILAWAMDGQPLTPETGWPLRYVDLHLYGYKCVKCLTELVVTREYKRGWWEDSCQYDINGIVLPGTITIVGPEALRYDIRTPGRVILERDKELDAGKRIPPKNPREFRALDEPQADFSGQDLSGSRFIDCRLMGANFQNARLDNCIFSRCALNEARFDNVSALGVRFDHTDLCQATLRKVQLNGARFSHSWLGSAILEEVQAENTSWEDIMFDDAKIKNSTLAKSRIVGGSFRDFSVTNSNLQKSTFRAARVIGARMATTNLESVVIEKANMMDSRLSGVNFENATFRNTKLDRCVFHKVRMNRALFSDVSFNHASLIDSDCTEAEFSTCSVFGMNVCCLRGTPARQQRINSAPEGEPELIVENIKFAGFLYELDRDDSLGHLVETLSSKVVLLLGRFNGEAKESLDALHEALRKRGYMPSIVDWDISGLRHSTEEVVQAIALFSKFVIADVTDPRSVLVELPKIVGARAVPVKPILAKGSREHSFLEGLRRQYRYLLPPYEYDDVDSLVHNMIPEVIAPCEEAVAALPQLYTAIK